MLCFDGGLSLGGHRGGVDLGDVGNASMCRDVLDHVRLLPERPPADGANERLLARVDLQMLLEVEPLRVDEESADGAALVLRPVVVHVQVEVVQVAD